MRTTLHPNGQKKSRGMYKGGKRHGLWIEWYSDGQKVSEGEYKSGKREGPWLEWYRNGKKASEGEYKGNTKEGPWAYWNDKGRKRKSLDGKVGWAAGHYANRHGGRRRMRARGPAHVAESIRLGLEWLRDHQGPSGKWSCAEFMKQCSARDTCDGPGNPAHDVGITGLALLAFLGDGSSSRSGSYKEVVKNGITWLRGQMNDEGLFGEASGNGYMYNHAVASMAMVEAYGLSRDEALKKPAQRCIDYIQASRNPYKVWRYYPRDGDNDSSLMCQGSCSII